MKSFAICILACLLLLTASITHAADNKYYNRPEFHRFTRYYGHNASRFHGINPGAPIWDGQTILTKQKIRQIAATGTRAIRLHFRLDGNKQWDTKLINQYRSIIRDLNNAQFEIIGLISHESLPYSQQQWNDTTNGPNNHYVKEFAKTATQLAQNTRLQFWEIWNEPDAWTNPNYELDPQHAGGTYILPEVYAHLLLETRIAFLDKQGEDHFPSRYQFITGGLFAHDLHGSRNTSANYLKQLYAQTDTWEACLNETGVYYPWNAIGYHIYINQSQSLDPKKFQSYLDDITNTILDAEDPSPILVTEFGWDTNSLSPDLQAANLKAAYDIFRANHNIIGTFWYQWQDEPDQKRGLIPTSVRNPKPAHAAFRDACQYKSLKEVKK